MYKNENKVSWLLSLKKGNKIHIKKENQGKFTDYCGGKVTLECILKGKSSSNSAIRKRATFAENARKWRKIAKHAGGNPMSYMQAALTALTIAGDVIGAIKGTKEEIEKNKLKEELDHLDKEVAAGAKIKFTGDNDTKTALTKQLDFLKNKLAQSGSLEEKYKTTQQLNQTTANLNQVELQSQISAKLFLDSINDLFNKQQQKEKAKADEKFNRFANGIMGAINAGGEIALMLGNAKTSTPPTGNPQSGINNLNSNIVLLNWNGLVKSGGLKIDSLAINNSINLGFDNINNLFNASLTSSMLSKKFGGVLTPNFSNKLKFINNLKYSK